MRYLKTQLTADKKQEVLERIDQYRRELLPLLVPITLLNHYVRKYGQPCPAQQAYLNLHPIELEMRTHTWLHCEALPRGNPVRKDGAVPAVY